MPSTPNQTPTPPAKPPQRKAPPQQVNANKPNPPKPPSQSSLGKAGIALLLPVLLAVIGSILFLMFRDSDGIFNFISPKNGIAINDADAPNSNNETDGFATNDPANPPNANNTSNANQSAAQNKNSNTNLAKFVPISPDAKPLPVDIIATNFYTTPNGHGWNVGFVSAYFINLSDQPVISTTLVLEKSFVETQEGKNYDVHGEDSSPNGFLLDPLKNGWIPVRIPFSDFRGLTELSFEYGDKTHLTRLVLEFHDMGQYALDLNQPIQPYVLSLDPQKTKTRNEFLTTKVSSSPQSKISFGECTDAQILDYTIENLDVTDNQYVSPEVPNNLAQYRPITDSSRGWAHGGIWTDPFTYQFTGSTFLGPGEKENYQYNLLRGCLVGHSICPDNSNQEGKEAVIFLEPQPDGSVIFYDMSCESSK